MSRPRLIPFKAEHLMLFVNRDVDFAFNLRHALMREHTGPSYTAVLSDEVIGCAGIMIPWPGLGIAWVALSKKMEKHAVWMHKMVKNVLYDTIIACRLHRVEACVLIGSDRNERWIESLGFVKENGRARAYTPEKHDVIRYELIVRNHDSSNAPS